MAIPRDLAETDDGNAKRAHGGIPVWGMTHASDAGGVIPGIVAYPHDDAKSSGSALSQDFAIVADEQGVSMPFQEEKSRREDAGSAERARAW